MTVRELIDRLKSFDPEIEVAILDGFNGGGAPRTINLGPVIRKVTKEDGCATADFEGMGGESVAVLGFGCY